MYNKAMQYSMWAKNLCIKKCLDNQWNGGESNDVTPWCRVVFSSSNPCPTTAYSFSGGKPVLESTRNDRVFVYFADHGGVGLVAMPIGDPVYAPDLIDALRYMSSNDRYLELVFYLEACESGSMFEGLLPKDVNIYATTAANSHESSYGTYCGEDSSVNGTVIGSCLGDLYSVSFLENSDKPSMFHTETLDSQFSLVKNETSMSHAQKVR